MTDEHDVIEAEIVGETIDEVAPTDPTPKRVESDKSRQIQVWSFITRNCLRRGLTLFIVAALGGLAFSISYSEQKLQLQLVLMIIAFSLSAFGVLAFLFGFIARRILIHYIKQDPNFTE